MAVHRPLFLTRARSALRVLACAALCAAAVPAVAQSYQDGQMQTLQMNRSLDAVSIQGSVEGWDVQKFRIPAERGQTLRLGLESRNRDVAFNLIHPSTGAVVYDGARSGRRAEVVLKNGGDWIVEVFLTRQAADRGDWADFRLDARLVNPVQEPKPPRPPVGNTSFFIVDGLGGYDSLNIRAEASLSGRVVARAPNGTRLTNGGCFASGGMTWCAVADPAGRFTGYASARYLVEERQAGWPPVQPKPPAPKPQPQALDAMAMMKACRNLAHETWNIPPGFIVPSEPVAVGNGFQSPVGTIVLNLSGTCTYDRNGNLLRFR